MIDGGADGEEDFMATVHGIEAIETLRQQVKALQRSSLDTCKLKDAAERGLAELKTDHDELLKELVTLRGMLKALKQQVPLGKEFSDVLHKNLLELYEGEKAQQPHPGRKGMTDTRNATNIVIGIESLRQRVKELEAKAKMDYAIIAGNNALIAGLKEELAALKPGQPNALAEFNEHWTSEEGNDPIERLRFFCSLAMRGQDWLDVEPFFDALKSAPSIPESNAVPDWVGAFLSRRAAVEQMLFNYAAGKQPLPTADQCREMALKLGVPDEYRQGKHN